MSEYNKGEESFDVFSDDIAPLAVGTMALPLGVEFYKRTRRNNIWHLTSENWEEFDLMQAFYGDFCERISGIPKSTTEYAGNKTNTTWIVEQVDLDAAISVLSDLGLSESK